MPRLLLQEELLHKTAALRAADNLGREMAQMSSNEELAKIAGAFFARQGLEKEGGLFGRMGAGIKNLFSRGASAAPSIYKKPANILMTPSYRATHPGDLVNKVTQGAQQATQGGFMKGLAGVGRSAATFGKVLPWAVGGGLAYAAVKGVPWAARQLERSSSQSMAPSMGWSPVPYGYGHTPYGDATPNMGYGA